MRNLRAAIGAILLAACGAAMGQIRQARVDIEPQPLPLALKSLGEQTGLQIMFRVEDLAKESLATPHVAGDLSPAEALKWLLSNSRLTYQFINRNTVLVRRTSLADNESAPTGSGASESSQTRRPDSAAGETRSEQSFGEGQAKALDDTAVLEEIVVTGTQIRGVVPPGSPLTVYGRGEIAHSGAGTLEQFFRKIPQNQSLVDAGTAVGGGTTGNNLEAGRNVSRGTGLNLRGLGSGSTLVLLNGHRLAPAGFDGSFVDVSMIPLSSIDRVEVLSDGASSIYGADAVGGVVNFVLRKDFQGAETSLRYGATSDGGGREQMASQLLGGSWRSGSGMLVYDYRDQDGVRIDQRDFIRNPSPGGTFLILPKQRRQTVLASGRQDLTSNTSIHVDGFYSDRTFEQDNDNLTGRSRNEGGAEQAGAVVGIETRIGGEWQGGIWGNYSRVGQDTDSSLFSPAIPAGLLTTESIRTKIASVDLRADGPVVAIPGGRVRASMGASGRREWFGDVALVNDAVIRQIDMDRDVYGVFGELFIPLVGERNARQWAQRFELSISARYDKYDDLGDATSPKAGVMWQLVPGLALRGTYARSFRAPPLQNLSDSGRRYTFYHVPDPGSPDGFTNTLIRTAIGNPSLGAEKSRSYTAGFDIAPPSLPGLQIAATYFNIRYTDKVAGPPLVGSVLTLYTQAASLSPFIHREPDLAEVQRIFNEEIVTNPLGFSPFVPESVNAIFDLRSQNIASTRTEGVDALVKYSVQTRRGNLGFFLNGTYVSELSFKSASTTPSVELLDKIFNPLDLRMRAGASWNIGALDAALMLNYSGAYENSLTTPPSPINSWTTADLFLSFDGSRTSRTVLRGLTVALSVQNLTNHDPPVISGTDLAAFNFGFDAVNATPIGRAVAMQLTKTW